MSKKIILFFIGIVFFFGYHSAKADVVINEVQLFPTEERFLELYNTGDEAIDLTGWYMQRKTATGSSFGSLVSNPNFEGKTIGAHDYFVISRNSLSDSSIVLDSLTLTESNTIQIKNSGGEVVDKVGWGNTDDCGDPCPSNPSEGQSIQKTGAGSWVIATPTPGEANKDSSSSLGSDDNDDEDGEDQSTTSTSSTETNTNTKTKTAAVLKIKAQITAKTLAYVGIPLKFEGTAFGHQGEQLFRGRYFWNFGDGDFREVNVINTDKFTHTYFYPGEYTVLLEYYPNYFAETPDAKEQIVIKVVAPEISISSVGDEKDFFVELSNNTDYAVDISNWFLVSDQKSFTIPQNTILVSKKKMIISSKISNLSILDKDTLKLITSEREPASDYSHLVSIPIATVPVKTPSKNIPKPKIYASQDRINSRQVLPPEAAAHVEEEQIPASISASLVGSTPENLPVLTNLNLGGSASVVESNIIKDNPIRAYFLTTILTLFIGISAGTVYFIRKKKIISNPGDDFDILND